MGFALYFEMVCAGQHSINVMRLCPEWAKHSVDVTGSCVGPRLYGGDCLWAVVVREGFVEEVGPERRAGVKGAAWKGEGHLGGGRSLCRGRTEGNAPGGSVQKSRRSL